MTTTAETGQVKQTTRAFMVEPGEVIEGAGEVTLVEVIETGTVEGMIELHFADGPYKQVRLVGDAYVTTVRKLYPGECPECGDFHDWYGYPDEFGNRFIEELGICNNCAGQ